jgi:hypothetical protein
MGYTTLCIALVMYHINQANNYQLILLQSFLDQLGFFLYATLPLTKPN